ncbi:DUF1642 domain-containing protein [Lacticaseibacillus parakribbianus]|uniref:DUF1642 domain-containing protein n=1 Tax=Lacticaseibacillus parakribbianus TaxID=2970927 RepID=UPI0021CB693D|nr:DUF1642 domain-containing protein [Lacticaseibacillus parakribbianus]
MSIWAIENDNQEFLSVRGIWLDGDGDDDAIRAVFGSYQEDEELAKTIAKREGGHVVELVEAPEKVVVSAEEAEMLEQAKFDDDPAELIVGFVNSHDKYDDDRKAEDRLMRAYVNGWVVEKPKRWNVQVPHVDAQEGLWFFVNSDGKVNATYDQDLAQKFTLAEIEHYGLGDCQKVVCADSARTTVEVTDDGEVRDE